MLRQNVTGSQKIITALFDKNNINSSQAKHLGRSLEGGNGSFRKETRGAFVYPLTFYNPGQM